MDILKKIVTSPLKSADIIINGSRPFDIQVHNERLYGRVLFQGSLGFGESYMDCDWDCDDLAEFISRVIQAGVDRGRLGLSGTFLKLAQLFHNAQNIRLARRVAERHYDLDNNLYKEMLDPRLVYTCGYFGRGAETLAQAQEGKMRLVCEKIGLKKGDRILDVGCGWGSFAKFAAEEFGAEVVGITIAQEQLALGQELCKGLPVELRYMDYRDVPKNFPKGHFDHIVSIGMFEAVGPKNFRTYMESLRPVLKKDGFFLLHTIGGPLGGFDSWIEKYIFPGGIIPTLEQISLSVRELFIIEDIHNIGANYDRTLCLWMKNFDASWEKLKATGKYDERFYRMWRYYLLSCAGSFRARANQLWQIVLSPNGVPGGYTSVR
ncbi:cyclopropane fatty acyl phospholipid synthase [Patescibacteria group bacterium]|nr:cyclopropane fatty acyl phospholipid synthase [Patescibacteria group bacterium]